MKGIDKNEFDIHFKETVGRILFKNRLEKKFRSGPVFLYYLYTYTFRKLQNSP